MHISGICHLTSFMFHHTFFPQPLCPFNRSHGGKNIYNYSDAMLNTQISCLMCGKSFRQRGFKKYKASCKAWGEAEKDCAQAGHHYEQTLDGEYWYNCHVTVPNSYDYVQNAEQLHLNAKHRNLNSADRQNDAAAGPPAIPSKFLSTVKLLPVDTNRFEVQALKGYEGNVSFLFVSQYHYIDPDIPYHDTRQSCSIWN